MLIMAMSLHHKSPAVALLQKIQASELDTFGRQTLQLPISGDGPLNEMYVEKNRAGTMNYPEGGYEFAAAATLYNPASLSYAASTDSHGSGSLGGLHSLNSMSPNPLVFLQTAPQLSPFVTHGQQVPYYVENEQSSCSSFGLREATPSTFYRINADNRRQRGSDHLSSTSEQSSPSAGALESSKETRYCAVCSDYASGYHYGVWSCEGCKAFFKRSIQGHNDYMCPATNQCTIDKNRRKSCQACRLRKCYEVGMMKGGIRKDRRGGRMLKHKRRKDEKDHINKSTGVPHRPPSSSVSSAQKNVKQNIVLSMTSDEILNTLMEAEPPMVYSEHDPSKPFTEASMMTLLTNLADKELVHMIIWAKKVPGFVDLTLHDQVQLLECCWLEILMIGLVWRSMEHPGKLIFAPDLVLDRNEGKCVEGMVEIFDMLLATVSRFRLLKLQCEEYICLKAIILLNSGVFPFLSSTMEALNDSEQIQIILDKITDALVHFITRAGLSLQQQSRRLAQLLLLLSHIRHMSNKGMEHLYSMKCKNIVPLYDLLLEMLDAHRMHTPVDKMQSDGNTPNPMNRGMTSSSSSLSLKKTESCPDKKCSARCAV
ncbi:estrogen receptor isoform X3 [Callorhinchus milii]|uniref:Estrogen receptor n=1 Tax=Callorhinchus milii TaxID=7868 RepID=A0A1V1FR36_CALMI|nr:estrogen receptor isoform X3 [Callorhinchus milii]BAX07663.1 estrogen receptor alpha [Callorhinchus milii]|eukprot:gi/632953754/ref/XP_007892596.1/ PREDICTED: estrogen receptor isoform X3 [Callorhinchus milii]